MPLYDFRCEHCEGIFEQRVPIARISTDTIECHYCQQQTLAKPMITGHQQINMKTKWRPGSGAEQLAGPLVEGPGTSKNSARSSVLHNCRGVNCSLCDV
ncbi:FmdB family zinc ribbon protein [Acinetobacter wanghuae]|uniref:FmdB family zinc ribbon protein n=1 Tax=Acinetobacter wanghuae TaxID=2662362 RepID=UPI003AF9E336